MKALAVLALAATGMGTAIYSGMPPERFRGDSAAIVIFTSDVESWCSAMPPYRVLACHKKVKDSSYIVLPNPCPYGEAGEAFATLACHEAAHANGWGAYHEP